MGGHVRIGWRHGEWKVVLSLALAVVKLVPDLDFQDVAAPAVGKRLADVELAGGRVLGTLHDLKDVAPRQLRNRLLRNRAIGELAGEYLHAQQVACG